ncbi:MAG: methyltransferase domain-containing protein [Gammaproteobacteria bacterium]|nr:methyltransferase domain-containing protein [Gammaproteobacteria bacterium]
MEGDVQPEVFQEFEKILAQRDVGERVLEIGAVPTSDSLLNIKSLSVAVERVGINLDGGESYQAGSANRVNEYRIVKADANRMDCFEDNTFDTVLCNSVFEHDKFFWKSIAEIQRVARNGALVVIATPGYDDMENIRLANVPRDVQDNFCANFRREIPPGTVTMRVHNWPGDFYRFSPQAYREVLFAGMRDVEVYSIMIPPRIFGIGYVVK